MRVDRVSTQLLGVGKMGILGILSIGLGLAADWEPLVVVATAYCPCMICCGERAAGLTADNTRVLEVPYGVASDPRQLPYGTIVYVPPGYGYLDRSKTAETDRHFTVDDTGGAIRKNTRATGIVHVDLRYKGHADAKKFGRKSITIYVWKD